MSLKLTVTAPDDPQVEAILRTVDSLGISPFEAKWAIERASRWLDLATDANYPASAAALPSPELLVGGDPILAGARPKKPPVIISTPAQLLAALHKAESFVAEELEVRRSSYAAGASQLEADEDADVAAAENTLALIRAAIAVVKP